MGAPRIFYSRSVQLQLIDLKKKRRTKSTAPVESIRALENQFERDLNFPLCVRERAYDLSEIRIQICPGGERARSRGSRH